jgi:phosphatidylglycerol lysyltransferase
LTKIPKEAVDWFAYLFSDSRPFGVVLLLLAGFYVGTSLLHRGSLKIFRWTLPVPPFRLTIYQIAIASADMLVAGSVLYTLFPPILGGYLKILEVYLVVYVLIVLSHVPGGWGVLEAGMMALLGTLQLVPNPEANMPMVVAGIIVFRVIYFLLPLTFSAALVGWHEYALRKKWIPPIVVTPEGAAEDLSSNVPSSNGKSETGELKRHVPSQKG